MTRRSIWWFVVTAFVLLVGAMIIWKRSSDNRSKENEGQKSREISEVKRELGRLRKAVAQQDALTRISWKSRRNEKNVPAPSKERVSSEVTEAKFSNKRKSPSHAEMYDYLSDHVDSEGTDPLWKKQTEGRIAAALKEQVLTGSTLMKSECRSTVCKVEIRFSSIESKRSDLMRLHHFSPFNQATYVHMYSPDDLDITVFVLKAGERWPWNANHQGD